MKTSRLLIAFSLISAPPPALAANLEFPVKDIVAACRDRASGIDDADFTSNWIKTCIGNARSSFVSAKIAWKTASLKAKEYCLTTTDPASKGDDFYQLFDFCLATEHMNENKDRLSSAAASCLRSNKRISARIGHGRQMGRG